MPVRISPLKSTTTTKRPIAKMVRDLAYNLAAQLRKPSSQGIISGPNPIGQKEGDTTIRLLPNGSLEVSVYDSAGQPASGIIGGDSNTSVSFQTGTVPPAIANFPVDGSNGQYYDTNLQQLWIVRNYQGTLIYPNFVSIAGTITAAQHGDLSAATFTAHKFSQISGSITAAQHGDFAAATANDALHSPASATHPGFMSIGQFNLLAGATSAATPSTLVGRSAAGAASFAGTSVFVNVNASGVYQVAGTRVVTTRQTGWTAITGTVSRATFATYTAPTITGPSITEVQNIANALQAVSRMVGALQQDFGATSGHGLIDA